MILVWIWGSIGEPFGATFLKFMVCDSDEIFKLFPGAVLDTLVAFGDPFW
jgi:hypothetical protein